MPKQLTSLRPISFKKSYVPHAEGSCLVTMGRTKVLCVATVENRVPPFAEEKGIGWIHAEYSMLPRAGEKRTSRKRASGSGRSQEISRLIGRSLRAAVAMDQLGPVTITIDCDVIRADGGTRTAAVNGGFVALALALMHLRKNQSLLSWPLRNYVGAVSVGLVQNKPVLDMSYEFDVRADADVNVVMTEKGEWIEVQGTGESRPFKQKELKTLLGLAEKGIHKIIRQQRKAVGKLPK